MYVRTTLQQYLLASSCDAEASRTIKEQKNKKQHPESRWLAFYGYSTAGTFSRWRVDRHPRFLADVNKDGKTDIVGFGDDGVYIFLSTGSGFTEASNVLKYYGYGKDAGKWRITNHPRLLGDVNGDGMVDIVGFATDGVMLSLSTGSGFNSGWRTDKHLRYLADADGDGMVNTVGFEGR